MKYRRQESSEREEKILNKWLFFIYLFIFSSTQHNPRLDPFRDFDIHGIARFSTQFPLPIICRDHHILRKSRFDARSTRLLAWRKIFEYIAWLSKKKKKKNRNQVWLNRSLPSSSSFTVISGGNPLGRDKDFNSPATERDIQDHTLDFLFLIEKKNILLLELYNI